MDGWMSRKMETSETLLATQEVQKTVPKHDFYRLIYSILANTNCVSYLILGKSLRYMQISA